LAEISSRYFVFIAGTDGTFRGSGEVAVGIYLVFFRNNIVLGNADCQLNKMLSARAKVKFCIACL
jgi:hypothetical protein